MLIRLLHFLRKLPGNCIAAARYLILKRLPREFRRRFLRRA